jgi:hypothetical protein
VRITDKPWWDVLIKTIAGVFLTFYGGQFALFASLRTRFRRYTELNQERLALLEKQVDPDRSSSELMKDGSNPPEDMV